MVARRIDEWTEYVLVGHRAWWRGVKHDDYGRFSVRGIICGLQDRRCISKNASRVPDEQQFGVWADDRWCLEGKRVRFQGPIR